MSTQGGHGVDLKINTGSLTTVVNLIDVDFPEQEKFLAEALYHDSGASYMSYICTGLRNLSEFEFTVAWDDTAATHAQILTSFNADTTVNMSIEDPLGQEVIAFAAHILKVKREGKSRDLFKGIITVQPSGAPTIT